jgi:Zn-dependent peptidase ImmA (M78 family)
MAKLAEELVNRAGIEYPPVGLQDLEEAAALQGIKRVSIIKMNCGGILLPVEGGFVAQLDSSQSEIRLRTSLAHEIGHTFFYDRTGTRPRLGFSRRSARTKVEEGLAWELARALLIPSKILAPMLQADPAWPSIRSFVDLKDAFCVSHSVLAKRLQDLAALESDYTWDGVIYGIHLDEKNVEDSTLTAWKFGRLRNVAAYSKAMSNNRRLLETVRQMKSDSINESQGYLMHDQFGRIPPGKYRIGCARAGSQVLLMLSNPSRARN